VKAFVVGGAGFIGSHLVDRLVAEDHTVDVIDNLTSGSLANLAEARSVGGALKFHHLDAASSEMDSSLGARSPDVVYHLALLTERSMGPAGAGDAVTSLLAVMEAARRHGVAKVVVALPAGALYGHPSTKSIPLKEREPGALEGRGVRGVVACALLDLLVLYRDTHAIEFAAALLPTVYGPRQRGDANVVASLVSAARAGVVPTITGDGRQTRDLLYVDDAVDALVRAAARGGGLAINVGTGIQTSVNDLWARIARLTGTVVEPARSAARPDELQRFALSPVRARIHLGWSPWTDVDDGLARTAGT
jgi:UDP-glucose 4-epimerase